MSLPGYYRWFAEQPARQGLNAEGAVIVVVSGLASLLSALVSIALAVFIYWRRKKDRAAVYVSVYLLIFGLVMSGPLEMLEYLFTGQSIIVSYKAQATLFPLFGVLLMLIFPNGVIKPASFRWLIPPLLLVSFSPLFLPVEELLKLESSRSVLIVIATLLFAIIGLGAQLYRYLRVSTPVERQQTKIVLFGLFVQLMLMLISSLGFYQQPVSSYNILVGNYSSLLWFVSLTIVPISLTLAVVRSHLWDIDVVIRKTLIYALLTAALALVYFGIVVFLQYASRVVIGHESPIAVVITTLVIAALFTPLRGTIQAVIDRRFFRGKYNAEQALARFQHSIRDRVDLEGLEQDLTGIVQTTVQPEWVGLWIRKP